MRVVLTGAAGGIGAAAAEVLRSQGAKITGVDVVEPDAADDWIAADLAEPAEIAAAAERAARDGPFDALVNCAGLPPRDGLAARILALNFLGLRAFTEAMLPQMAECGALVSVASRAGSQWRENIVQVKALAAIDGPGALDEFVTKHRIDPTRAYFLSKEAVIAWTLGNTERLLHMGLRANCVSPAAVDTGILPDFVTAFGTRAEKGLARAGRAGRPREIAELIAFLAGPHSRWIKGQNIGIDGGLAAMAEADAMGLDLGPGKT